MSRRCYRGPHNAEKLSRGEAVRQLVASLEPELNRSSDPDVREFLARWIRRRGVLRCVGPADDLET